MSKLYHPLYENWKKNQIILKFTYTPYIFCSKIETGNFKLLTILFEAFFGTFGKLENLSVFSRSGFEADKGFGVDFGVGVTIHVDTEFNSGGKLE